MKKTFLILFILLPALVLSSIIILPDKAVSQQENRSLMTKSTISKTLENSRFQNDFETYLSDQFPFKDELVFCQTKLKLLCNQKDISGAYICKNGRLIQKIIPSDINEKSIVSYAEKINDIAKENKVFVFYVPSAEITLNNLLPGGAPTYDWNSLFEKLSSHLENASVINSEKALENEKFYYKTDHHWNAYGAYKAYEEFCDAKGVEASPLEDFSLKSVSKDFKGTLHSKVPAINSADEILLPEVQDLKVTADGKEIDFYDMSALETKDKYNVFQGGNHGIVEIENKDAKSDKTLLILKDSFANSFAAYISGDYKKIIMLDERYTFISLKEYVKMIKPDEILVLREIIN